MKRILCFLLAGQLSLAHSQEELALRKQLNTLWSKPALSAPKPVLAASPVQDQPSKGIDPATLKAIHNGLKALAKIQNRDGSFGNEKAPVATTSLAGLAFLAGNHTPRRGVYAPQVQKAVGYILGKSARSGYITEGTGKSWGDGGSGMHGHGYAVLFLTQVYGMMDDPGSDESERIREAISRGLRVIEQSQSKEGGWTYTPDASTDEGSVTVTQVQALRAARDIGFKVNMQTIEKATEYMNRSTDESGQTGYSLSSKETKSHVITGAGLCVLLYLGLYKNKKIQKGLDHLLANALPKPGTKPMGGYFFYGNFYATLAMYQGGEAYWRTWWPAMEKAMIEAQDIAGLWKKDESSNYGDAFGTSLALLTLQIPLNYLPIFQR